MLTPGITSNKKRGDEGAAPFAVRVHAIVSYPASTNESLQSFNLE